jgi:signal transduction histidine kinase/transcriptional regulator with GAF, ATPase, and Fis domain
MVGKKMNKNRPLQLSDIQDLLRSLSQKNLDDCLFKIALVLRRMLRCETVSILLWKEDRQHLITKFPVGMPRQLTKPEIYKRDEGITGKYVFDAEATIRAIIHFDEEVVQDMETGAAIRDESIQWFGMKHFRSRSKYKDFKSLLCAPLIVNKQKLGVVKLINRLAEGSDDLAPQGFSKEDLNTLESFLSFIQHVIETKRNEEQINALLKISLQNSSTLFDLKEVLRGIASSCAQIFNYKICVVRLLEGETFKIRANSLNDLVPSEYENDCVPAALATEGNHTLAWSAKSGLRRFDGGLVYPSFEIPKIVRDYDIQSFLVVPISSQGRSLGTIECFTTLPHDFSGQEVEAIKQYVRHLIIALMNNEHQGLLQRLVKLHPVEMVPAPEKREEELIRSILGDIRASLWQQPVALGIIFSKTRVNLTMLQLESLYGIEPDDLSRVLQREGLKCVNEMLRNDQYVETLEWDTSQGYTVPSRKQPVHVYRAAISATEGGSVGWLILATYGIKDINAFSKQIIDLSAKHLGVILENYDRVRKHGLLLEMIKSVSTKESAEEIYAYILEKTINHFKFDYGAISTVDFVTGEISTQYCDSAKPYLVDPASWKGLSRYKLTDSDILADVIRRREPEIISGPEEEQKGSLDPRLNPEIYYRSNHKECIRIFIPFVFRSDQSPDQKEKEIAVGVIEAGYHVSTRSFISVEQKELFIVFIDYCAEALQRTHRLSESKQIEDFLDKLSKHTDPEELLTTLLQQAVDFMRAPAGILMLLTHRDEGLALSDARVARELSDDQRRYLLDSLQNRAQAQGRSIYAELIERGNAASGEPAYFVNPESEQGWLMVEPGRALKSELVVPLRFSGKVIGVIGIYAYDANWFDRKPLEQLAAILDQATVFYQNARISTGLEDLKKPYNFFSTAKDIYKSSCQTIEQFLKTDAISIWEKNTEKESGSFLGRVWASEGLHAKYEQAHITGLPAESFTGQAVITRTLTEADYKKIQGVQFRNSQFVLENGLKSMTCVPIIAGQGTYGAIDVFSRRDAELFPDEKKFLEVLASKVAIAIQNAKLIAYFDPISGDPKVIADALATGKINSILQKIAEGAVDILKANSVVLFRYDPASKEWMLPMIYAGRLIDDKIRERTNTVRQDDLVDWIRKLDTRYFDSEAEYLAFRAETGYKEHPQPSVTDFWHRERIKSMAAVRLNHPSGIQGVMFFNFREPRSFNPPTIQLIEGFVAQAASVIASAKLLVQQKERWEKERRHSLAISVNYIVAGLAHNSGNLIDSLWERHTSFERKIAQRGGDQISKAECLRILRALKKPVRTLVADFRKLREYRRFDRFDEDFYDVKELVESSLSLLKGKFKSIDVDRKYGETPRIFCDRNQIQHVLLNLFQNSYDAMNKSGKLEIETNVDTRRGSVIIRVRDDGSGIPPGIRSRLFEPFFSTKKSRNGTGLGLSTSRYIVERHGGKLELERSTGRGTTFAIYLPIK